MVEAEQKEHPAQKTTAATGRSKAKLGLNHALMRIFGVHKSSEIRKPVKPVVQDKKEKEESKTRKSAENPKTSKNPAASGNFRTSKAADSRHVVRKNLPEEVNRLTSNLELSEEDRREIASYIQNCRTKQSINNELVRRFRSEKAGEVYKAVKPLIQDKKGKEEPKKTSKAAGMSQTSKNVRTSGPLSDAGKNLSEEVSRLTSGLQLSEEDRRQIASYVQNYKTKQGVNNALVRRFRSQKAGEIYKMIKPLLKEKKGRSHSNSHKR